jgi:hypothetical protein
MKGKNDELALLRRLCDSRDETEIAELFTTIYDRMTAGKEMWQILDNIDTAGDAAKDDDNLYRSMVQHLCERRHEYYTSDGYSLYAATTRRRMDGTPIGEDTQDAVVYALKSTVEETSRILDDAEIVDVQLYFQRQQNERFKQVVQLVRERFERMMDRAGPIHDEDRQHLEAKRCEFEDEIGGDYSLALFLMFLVTE